MTAIFLTVILSAPPKAVSVPGVVVSATTTEPAEKPVVCPPGRFVVLVPNTDDKLTYLPAGVVTRYPATATIIHHLKWDEPAGTPPKDYTFKDAKGPLAVVFPDRDVTIQILRNGPDGPELIQTVDVKTGLGPRPPPIPIDPPKPPGPTPEPVVNENPFGDVQGLYVLMVYDTTNTTRPQTQMGVLFGKPVDDWMTTHCVTDPSPDSTNHKAYRIYPADANVTNSPAPFKAAFGFRPETGKERIVIGNGKRGYVGPLPKTTAEAVALLELYQGP